MARNSFLYYRSFAGLINLLPNEKKLAIYDAINAYALDGKETTFEDEQSRDIWAIIKPKLQSGRTKWENGSKGGAPPGNQNARKGEKETLKLIKSAVREKVTKAEYDLWVDAIDECKSEDGNIRFTVPTENMERTLENSYTDIFKCAFREIGIEAKTILFISRYGHDSSQPQSGKYGL